MKRLKMATKTDLTLEEGCNKYLDNCRQRIIVVNIFVYLFNESVNAFKFFVSISETIFSLEFIRS